MRRFDAEVSRWDTPAVFPTLPVGEVQIWTAPLELSQATLDALFQTLSTSERARAERFHFVRDRRFFIAAHGILRDVIGRYLRLPPAELDFGFGPHGKPYLATPSAGKVLHFNLSHSHELALIALAADREVGVDVEWIQCRLDGSEIAERFFSPGEGAALRALPPSEQPNAFFYYWTCKEAFLKACGKGLSAPLNSFDVPLNSTETVLKSEGSTWSLRAIPSEDGYAAAVAAEGTGWTTALWRWGWG